MGPVAQSPCRLTCLMQVIKMGERFDQCQTVFAFPDIALEQGFETIPGTLGLCDMSDEPF